MKRFETWMLGMLGLVLMSAGCTHRDAATVGAAAGRVIGTPLGTAITVVDETIQTMDDVVAANPRSGDPAPEATSSDGRPPSVSDRGPSPEPHPEAIRFWH